MRILVNTRFLLPDKLEGIGLHSYEILKRIVRDHPEDHFIFCFDRSYSKDHMFGPNVTPVILRPPARHPVLFYWWFERMIPQAFKRHQADLFYSPDGFLSLSKTVRKSLLVIHDLAYLHYPDQIKWSERQYYRHFMPKFIARADHIVTVSKTTQHDLITHFPNSRSKTSVVYNGVRDFTDFDSVADNSLDETRYFIALGAIHPRKNITNLLLAFDQFKMKTDNNIKLKLVGRMAWKVHEIQATLQQMKHQEDVHLTGYVDDHALLNLMRGSLGLVYVSLFEGFGLPIVEAMKLGVPVITSDRSSMKEVAGGAALLVDPMAPVTIADAMARLSQNKDLAEKLQEQGYKRSKAFSWDKSAREIYGLMEEVANL